MFCNCGVTIGEKNNNEILLPKTEFPISKAEKLEVNLNFLIILIKKNQSLVRKKLKIIFLKD